MTAADDPANDSLIITLELAVPLRMLELAGMSEARRERTRASWAQESASSVGHQGDALIFGNPTKARRHGRCATCGGDISQDREGWYHIAAEGRVLTCPDGRKPKLVGDPEAGTAAAFNALARGLAALAWQPGGVTFMGAHWCALGCDACPERAA